MLPASGGQDELVFERSTASTLRSRIDSLRKLKVRWYFKVLRVSGLKGAAWPRDTDLTVSWTAPAAKAGPTAKGKTRRQRIYGDELSFVADAADAGGHGSLIAQYEDEKRKSKKEAAGNLFAYSATLRRETQTTTNTTCAAAHWKVIFLQWSLKVPHEKNKLTRAVRVLASGQLSLVDCAYKSAREVRVELAPSGRIVSLGAPVVLHLLVQCHLVDKTKFAMLLTSPSASSVPLALQPTDSDDSPGLPHDDSDDDTADDAEDEQKLRLARTQLERSRQALLAVDQAIAANTQLIDQLTADNRCQRRADEHTIAEKRADIRALLPQLDALVDRVHQREHAVAELHQQFLAYTDLYRATIVHKHAADTNNNSDDDHDSGLVQLAGFIVLIVAVFVVRLFT